MDALLYLESAKRCLQIEVNKCMLSQMDPFKNGQRNEKERV